MFRRRLLLISMPFLLSLPISMILFTLIMMPDAARQLR